MTIFRRIFDRCADALIARVTKRLPDFVIGGHAAPYLLRWWLIPRNRCFNVYLHRFLRDDDDRALHDHPWPWCSVLLRGHYIEHTIAAGGIHRRKGRDAPGIRFASARRAHRVELRPVWYCEDDMDAAFDVWRAAPTAKAPAWTLFITGPVVREWGFHCPQRGWVHWKEFTAAEDPGAIGRGCGERDG